MAKYKTLEIREALREAIDEEMTRDSNVCILGEEVGEYNGAYKVTKGLLDKWGPKRVIDTPISEAAFSGIGIGAAMLGLRPIIEFMSWNFSFVAADQIISHAAKMHYMTGGKFSVPIVFRGPNGAAAQVSCQHSHCVEALYANIPGLIIIAPSTPQDAKGLLKSAIRNNNPVLFLENELEYNLKGEVPTQEYLVPIGKARLVQEGKDLTIITYSRMVSITQQACSLAKKRWGLSIEIIDLRTIKPLDLSSILSSIQKTSRCIVIEEGHYFSGISAEIIATITEYAFDYLDTAPLRICQKETPMPYSKVLEQATLPNINRILDTIEKVMR
ncbi:2-oxoisovalerate dehydrogenase subunit beta,pyruvate dehydrogenase subunit beta,Pyruvate/2-oxoglutarate dehydrogenase complex, dehydrogenase (E1) component, eukaryotic type, beta subunit,1-deoxy-D-xylulose-5-phosphate synthase,Transketolase, pyrimidine binding domain [Chlamydia serpentis]|uniref:Transketolase-like pyrimidine-binding domain-containing protein n=1 Tax=Chlamydia serpentis TaxID=1967782 RepID=A0A2R8FAK1_9CHLA|nr:alpha-ketoacid dehydrogenase subunit beta [Chlamydia serpentis]SPN73449.1 2-oxoisovalerate dehydrogenase subunit beta,pyruvate dehydrogenase subunit beta,Pyruvate/2-oxoglutarate dehydrogenase complex, dehydrogenase (E1) component, eukaryotic type, beta subunit,1-deoxy-D-xylulose-5-phosphate synthase,Transketolase, pyrimidine binding domain [Chlamydia serpentis]